jgi:hypothetical protein
MPYGRCHRSAAGVSGLCGACTTLAVVSCLAQDAKPPSDAAKREPAPANQPTLIYPFGRWFEESMQAAKDAAGMILGLSNTGIVTVHERCAVAASGAPDCQTTAIAVCRGKGFGTGKILDTQSEQKCPSSLLLQGRRPNDADCATEIFVTRALCQ